MDTKEALRKERINNIVLGMALLISVGFFFYGMINNIQAQKEKEIAQDETKKALACEKYSLLLTEQLQEKERQLTQARAEAAFLMEQTREKRNK
jgi:F0F1-type ATP synthase membrane subunit b/b'